MNNEFIGRVKGHYYGLSKTEKKIADYLLANAKQVQHLSIQDMSEKMQVSMSAISRFTKKIGYCSYQEMRFQLVDSARVQESNFFITIGDHDSAMNIAKATFQSGITSLTSTLAVLNDDTLEQAAAIMQKASICGLFGLGASSAMTLHAYHRFLRTSLNCSHSADYHLQLMAAGKLGEQDCALIISHSGRNKDILRIVDVLVERRVPIICITSNAVSPLAKKSNVYIYYISEETKFRPEAVSSIASQMMLIDTLFTMYSIRIDQDEEYFERIRTIVNTTRI